MASFYSNVTNEGDILPTTYLLSQKHASYPSSELHNNKAHGQPSLSVSYLNLLSGNSMLAHDHVDTESIRSRDETLFVPPTGVPSGMQQFDRQLNFMSQFSDGDAVGANSHVFSKELVHDHSSAQHSQYHGLCLSLGSQEPSLVQLSSDLNQYTTSSLCSFLGSNVAQSEDQQLSQNNGLKNVEYLSFDLSGGTQNAVKYEIVNNFQNFTSSKETSFLPSLHQTPGFSGTICDSKYLKAAQDLLDEVVNVHRTLQQSEKCENNNSLGQDASRGTELGRDCFSSELHESITNATPDLSPSERHGLQDKMTKLFSMLDEVDRRYKQYFHQMQIVVSSFDTVAGRGAAKPYSALALLTISRQFRSLRDAIKKQIEATQKILGEQDANTHGQGVLSRLRYVDQKLRQQKAVQQFGILRQPWRPQRGLPETAVSVLRAWLFEHFLHPYPKDSEKIVLARQAGLTRSQVANWFINARVRLWKPMIEDIYKEEFGDAETEPKASPERAVATPEISAFDDREEEFQGNFMSAAADGNHWARSNESRPDGFSSAKIDACREELGFEAGAYQENEVNCALTHLQNKQILKVAKRPDNGRQNDLVFDGTKGNQVSLALGLQHNEKDPQLISGGIQLKGNDTASSSAGLDKLECFNVDTVNHQARFANPNLLSDFVAR